MTKKQTHKVIADEIVKVFNDYGIVVEKVTHIVTDGGQIRKSVPSLWQR